MLFAPWWRLSVRKYKDYLLTCLLSLSDAVHLCPLLLSSHFIVCYVVLPFDLQRMSLTMHLKRHRATLIVFLGGPCFCCI